VNILRYRDILFIDRRDMGNTSNAMVSRSLRLKKETLDVLHEQAKKNNLGITVYIRTVLESLVENLAEEVEVHN
jgi:hypothetical protein